YPAHLPREIGRPLRQINLPLIARLERVKPTGEALPKLRPILVRKKNDSSGHTVFDGISARSALAGRTARACAFLSILNIRQNPALQSIVTPLRRILVLKRRIASKLQRVRIDGKSLDSPLKAAGRLNQKLPRPPPCAA